MNYLWFKEVDANCEISVVRCLHCHGDISHFYVFVEMDGFVRGFVTVFADNPISRFCRLRQGSSHTEIGRQDLANNNAALM
jgi:hypothetical protein